MSLEEIIKLVDNYEFFDGYDKQKLKEIGVFDLSKEELCILVERMSMIMKDSTKGWEGG